MTSREGYDAYTLYLGIKLHFYSNEYDFVKYNGKVKADIKSFLKRKDKYHFGKLFRTYKHELQDFYIANLSQKDLWAGDLLSDECAKVYKEWKKNNQKLTYLFETEVSDLLRKKNIQKVLEVKNGQHPILLKEFMAKKVSLETICIMDEIIEFTKDWDRLISERIIYPGIHVKINKYKSFVEFNRVKYKSKLIDLCE
jgi:hypothetical protein|tara:strand:- start:31587 stop:32177 length:591 start_codon:yes stop_codon:yes gene_type:complete